MTAAKNSPPRLPRPSTADLHCAQPVPAEPVSVLVVDDRRSVREELARVLAAVPGVAHVTITRPNDVVTHYTWSPANVVLLGTQRATADGLDALRLLLRTHPGAAVLALGAGDDALSMGAAMYAGARGYLRWTPDAATLTAVTTLAQQSAASPHAAVTDLSDRELQVLCRIADGMANAQIGRTLGLSEDTVKTHVRRIFRKIGAHDRAHAVAIGFRQGLLS